MLTCLEDERESAGYTSMCGEYVRTTRSRGDMLIPHGMHGMEGRAGGKLARSLKDDGMQRASMIMPTGLLG